MRLTTRTLGALTASAVSLSLVLPAGAGAAPQRSGFQGTITIDAGTHYNPALHGAQSGQAVVPGHALEQLATQWEKAHPGVQIKFVDTMEGSDPVAIARTRLTGGTAPDIFAFYAEGGTGSDVDLYTRAGLMVDLTPYFNRPNPYIPGNTTWLSTFHSPWKEVGRTASGKYGEIPIELGSQAIYYNGQITRKLGLAMPPATWADLIADMKKIKSAGYLAMGGVASPYQMLFAVSNIEPQLQYGEVSKLAALSYHPDYVPGYVTTEDWARAYIKEGYRLAKSPGFIATMRLIKEWAGYLMPGWASGNGGNAAQLFAQGRLAFYWSGTWEAPTIQQEQLTFPHGAFVVPVVTRASTPAAANPPLYLQEAYGFNNGFAVAGSAAKDPAKLALVINFLQYISTPQANASIVDEHATGVPAIVGAKPSPTLRFFATIHMPSILIKTNGQEPVRVDTAMLPDDQLSFLRNMIPYAQGATSESDFLSQEDAVFLKDLQQQVATNDKAKNKTGTWDLTKW